MQQAVRKSCAHDRGAELELAHTFGAVLPTTNQLEDADLYVCIGIDGNPCPFAGRIHRNGVDPSTTTIFCHYSGRHMATSDTMGCVHANSN